MNLQTLRLVKGLLLILLLLCGTLNLSAQVFTDEEIGFNREEVREMYLDEEVDEADLHRKLALFRESLLEAHLLKLADPLPPQITSLGCGNIDFKEGFNDVQNEWLYEEWRPQNPINTYFATFSLPSRSKIINKNNIVASDAPGIVTVEQLGLDQFESNFIRLGDNLAGGFAKRISKKIKVTEENRLFTYRYAVVLENPPHDHHQQPYFEVYIKDQSGTVIQCTEFNATAPGTSQGGLSGFIPIGNVYYRPVSTNIIDLMEYVQLNDEITLIIEVSDCYFVQHYGYAFFEGSCTGIDGAIVADTNGQGLCAGIDITFNATQDYFGDNLPQWEILSGSNVVGSVTAPTITHYFSVPGEYTVKVTIPLEGYNCYSEIVFTRVITIEECPCVCECDSFNPVPGERYVVSGWVYEEYGTPPLSYENTSISLSFDRSPYTAVSRVFKPSGAIIDGWQRIMGEFIVPFNSNSIKISLNNDNASVNAYFDDIRIHPFNSNLKSFVYDQVTLQLMAELDENNYATFYEYDKEGGLVRIKKETERGVYTIQETRSGNSQLNIPQN